jgi:toxin CptA
MRNRHNCWSTSAPFRYEWKPSRWLTAALLLLGVLAAFALLNCDLPMPYAWPLAVLAMAWATRLAWIEHFRVPRSLLICPSSATARIDGGAVERLELLERGPLRVLRWWGEGRHGQLLFWPDTLPRRRRRELRLAVHAHSVSCNAATVAP